MLPSPFRVVLDACVLFPFTLRDTLLRAAEAGLYQACWTEEILEEAGRNLVKQGRATEQRAEKLFALIRKAFPEALVADHEALIKAMMNNPKDRRVVAAAVKAGAQVIVTANLTDFSVLPAAVEVQSPDHFLCNLFDLEPALMSQIVREQAAALRRPPIELKDLLSGLARSTPNFVELLKMARQP